VRKLKTLDDARAAYLNGKINAEQYFAYLRKNVLVDEKRKSIEKDNKKIERKLVTV
jgi:hypothetical protein